MLFAQTEQINQASDWLFGLEGPALILSIAINVAIAFAYWKKDREKADLETDFRAYMKSEADERREEMNNQLSVVNSNTVALETLKGSVIDGSGRVVTGLNECSGKIDHVASDLRRALEKP